ncbi:ABC transporter substrate-binding protein [Cryptosporangium aurantiacum]|uniref:Peptide/nickel transport system substrate-binding protein n=1 Tax=Cryptosporangium aurantiacum TaxID=134849 RepID=A0A1M7R1Z9_9ACTN|nr:ABC transporter substrate-binding protein [Cryptosporangium aurantiacum]SHN38947.1 peptide/nickel transport system substrate-binding protein [Cryptosporangium aurantiacum]
MNRPLRVAAFAAAVTVGLAGGAVAGVGGVSADNVRAGGGTLTMYAGSVSGLFEPSNGFIYPTGSHGWLFRRLTTWVSERGKPPAVVPDLATNTGTTTDGGKTWTYRLKDRIAFQDGSPVTSRDIKYAVERSFDPQFVDSSDFHKRLLIGGDTYTGPSGGKSLASVETPDAKTIIFHLRRASSEWPWIAGLGSFAPVPEGKGDPRAYGRNPVATGPYQVRSNPAGGPVRLVRNRHWNAETDPVRTAGPDEIVFEEVRDRAAMTRRLIDDEGAAKFAFNGETLGPRELAVVNRDRDAASRLVTNPVPILWMLALNTRRGALTDVTVRRAIQYAVDRRAFRTALGGDQVAVPATNLNPPGIPGREEIDPYRAGSSGDVTQAKRLLVQAGRATGLRLTLWALDDSTIGRYQLSGRAQVDALQRGLQRAGITVTVRYVNVATMKASQSEDNPGYDIAVAWWRVDYPSGGGTLAPLFHSRSIGGNGYNLSRYESPETDAMIDQAAAEMNPRKAGERWTAVDRRIMWDAAGVPLAFEKRSYLHGSRVAFSTFLGFPGYRGISVRPGDPRG